MTDPRCKLADTLRAHHRWVVLTGAGISAASGIPTYRDDSGQWQRSDPIQHQEFIDQPAKRQRYWARSMVGWRHVEQASPNKAHLALSELENVLPINLLVTQNVDRLHQKAGSTRVIDLHGRLDRVICRSCGQIIERKSLQTSLESLNPGLEQVMAEQLPDGDADVPDAWLNDFIIPVCNQCDGLLMPDVVFFGGSVPRDRVAQVSKAIEEADGLMVLGSSLTVYSGYRFCRQVAAANKPLVIVNRGITRADDLASLKLEQDCGIVLDNLMEQFHGS